MRSLLVLALALLAPLAYAQPLPAGAPATSLGISLEDPGGNGLVTGQENLVSILVNYQYPAGSQPAPNPSPDVAENTTPTRITFSLRSQPSWVLNATFIPPQLDVPIPFPAAKPGNVPLRMNVSLFVSPTAPALKREDLVIVGDAAANGNMAAAHGESPPLTLKARAFGKLNVSGADTTILPGGRWTTVSYTVKNEGNGEVVAKINLTVKPENSEVEFPKSVTLAPGASTTVDVRIRTPWTNAEVGSLTLEAIPIIDGSDGKAASHEVEVRGESAVPGAGVTLALAALGIALLGGTRRG